MRSLSPMLRAWRLPPLALLGWLAAAQPAWAGAWPQPEDGGFIAFPLMPYQARLQGYDRRGLPTANGTQTSLDFSPYWEHGLAPRWTGGLSPRLGAIWLEQNGRQPRNAGLYEGQAFLRYALHVGQNDVLSVQGQVGSPGMAQRPRDPSLAETSPTYEARLLYGRGFGLFAGMNGFVDLQAAYRYRAGAAADVAFASATLGVRPVPDFAVWVQSLTDLGLRNGRAGGSDYAVERLAFTLAWDATPRSSFVLSYMRELAVRHVPMGHGITLAYWHRY